jgi:hypothetical protein
LHIEGWKFHGVKIIFEWSLASFVEKCNGVLARNGFGLKKILGTINSRLGMSKI